MKKELRLSLKSKWFEMTDPGGKTEDYRELNNYWHKRLFTKESIEHMKECQENHGGCMHVDSLVFKPFDHNVMTLGYPKSTDKSRIKMYEHAGIEIRAGNPDWGAEPGKLYFVIKHGKKIE